MSSDATDVAARIRADAAVKAAGAHRNALDIGAQLLSSVRRHQLGRPGPQRITGDLNRSNTLDVAYAGGVTVVTVGTNKVQARRLEYGFMGLTDVLGRTYQQPPYPSYGPARDEVEPTVLPLALKALGERA